MEDLVKEVINVYFTEYKSFQVWILIAFTVISIIFQLIQTYWISKKLETFKNHLKKSEIKFSRYSELQINALRSIYHLLCEFHQANIALFDTEFNKIDHIHYKNILLNWINKYFTATNELTRERILLTPELIECVTNSLQVFNSVKEIVNSEHKYLIDLESDNFGDYTLMYEFEENEIEAISNALNKLRKEDFIKNSNESIRNLRNKIEEHFQKINF